MKAKMLLSPFYYRDNPAIKTVIDPNKCKCPVKGDCIMMRGGKDNTKQSV